MNLVDGEYGIVPHGRESWHAKSDGQEIIVPLDFPSFAPFWRLGACVSQPAGPHALTRRPAPIRALAALPRATLTR